MGWGQRPALASRRPRSGWKTVKKLKAWLAKRLQNLRLWFPSASVQPPEANINA